MTKERIEAHWEKVKNEIPRAQFDAMIYWKERLKKNGWKFVGIAAGDEYSLILTVKKGRYNHWFRICKNGNAGFIPVEMGVKQNG